VVVCRDSSTCFGSRLCAIGPFSARPVRGCTHASAFSSQAYPFTDCLETADPKFTKAHGKAIEAGDCINSTDALTVQGKIDAFIDSLRATLAP
jgi:hypothetical protein